MAIFRFKVRGLPVVSSKRKPTDVKKSIFEDESLIITYAQSQIKPSDISMQVVFPSEVLLNLLNRVFSNAMYSLRIELLNNISNKPTFVKNLLEYTEALSQKNDHKDKAGYINDSVHENVLEIFNKALTLKYISNSDYIEFYRKNYIIKTILAVKNASPDVVGEFKITPGQQEFGKLYEQVTLPLKGKDALDNDDVGLTSEESYRLFLFNGERFQKIIPTFNTSESDNNPGQFEDLRIHVISSVSLEKPIDKI